jgi:hypothetical protein
MQLYWHEPSQRTELPNASDSLFDAGGLGFRGHGVVCDDIEGAHYALIANKDARRRATTSLDLRLRYRDRK